MTRLIAVLCLVALAGADAAVAIPRDVTIPPSRLAFTPQVVNLLVGDSVRWTNKDNRPHDVWSTPDGAEFKSGLFTFGESFESPTFTSTEDVPYLCHEHPIMTGLIRIHEIWLSGPAAPVLHGTSAKLTGLAPQGTEVDVERLVGETWTLVETVTAGDQDVFSRVVPAVPAQYRAVLPSNVASRTVTVVIKPRVTLAKKRLPTKRTRVTATAAPNRAGAVAVLQRKKPAGWAVLASKRLNTSSKAAFVVRPPKGTWRVRVIVKKSGGYAAGQSGVVAVKR